MALAASLALGASSALADVKKLPTLRVVLAGDFNHENYFLVVDRIDSPTHTVGFMCKLAREDRVPEKVVQLAHQHIKILVPDCDPIKDYPDLRIGFVGTKTSTPLWSLHDGKIPDAPKFQCVPSDILDGAFIVGSGS